MFRLLRALTHDPEILLAYRVCFVGKNTTITMRLISPGVFMPRYYLQDITIITWNISKVTLWNDTSNIFNSLDRIKRFGGSINLELNLIMVKNKSNITKADILALRVPNVIDLLYGISWSTNAMRKHVTFRWLWNNFCYLEFPITFSEFSSWMSSKAWGKLNNYT